MAEKLLCSACGHVGFDCKDGYYHCQGCGFEAKDMIETGAADEDFLVDGDASALYTKGNRRAGQTVVKTEPFTFQTQDSQFWSKLNLAEEQKPIKKEYDDTQPYVPDDFSGTFNDLPTPESFLSEIRIRYVMGIQLMIQFQCQALVETFHVSPLICGLTGVIWLRFVSVSRVFDERWADDAIEASEMQKAGNPTVTKLRGKYGKEPHNMYGRRAATIWLRSLRKKIPLCTSLAVSFLACHISREAILPTDIVKWALEGKLPYLNAFLDIEKTVGRPSITCPFSSSFMFRPFQVVGPMELEGYAGSIAQRLGLELPPVNFFTIARRYLKQLRLPVEKILPYASRIYEWSMPPDLWLSANPKRLPSRLCVMSIIMIAIRVLHNINGFGKWEEMVSGVDGCSSRYRAKKSNSKCKVQSRIYGSKECSQSSDPKLNPDRSNCTKRASPSGNLSEKSKSTIRGLLNVQNSEFDTTQLLSNLEATYDKICDTHDYSKDLPTYLKYCKDVVFDGLAPSFEDHEEEELIKQLWTSFENQEESKPPEKAGIGCSSRCSQVHFNSMQMDDVKPNVGCSSSAPRRDGTSDVDAHMRQIFDGDHRQVHFNSMQMYDVKPNVGCSSSVPRRDGTSDADAHMRQIFDGDHRQVHFNSMQMDDVKPNVGCSSSVPRRDGTSDVDAHMRQIFNGDHRQVHFNSMQMDDVKPNVGCSSSVPRRDGTSDVDAHMRQIFDGDHRQEKKNPLPHDRALKQLKSNMEENGFCYIPPRVNLKRFDYLHYVRKNDDGTLSYVAHADYYILLRVCARLVQVDARYMHVGMLRLEKRLAWIEKGIDYCLHLKPPNLCPESDVDVDADADAEPPIDMNDSNVKENCMD